LHLDEKGEKIIHERIRVSVDADTHDVTEINGTWQYHYRDILFKLGKAMEINTDATAMPLGGFSASYNTEDLEYKRAKHVYDKMLPYQINKQVRRMNKWAKRQENGPGFFEKLFSRD
jgi:hypothetical protein